MEKDIEQRKLSNVADKDLVRYSFEDSVSTASVKRH